MRTAASPPLTPVRVVKPRPSSGIRASTVCLATGSPLVQTRVTRGLRGTSLPHLVSAGRVTFAEHNAVAGLISACESTTSLRAAGELALKLASSDHERRGLAARVAHRRIELAAGRRFPFSFREWHSIPI